jgi:hypothetical protein
MQVVVKRSGSPTFCDAPIGIVSVTVVNLDFAVPVAPDAAEFPFDEVEAIGLEFSVIQVGSARDR